MPYNIKEVEKWMEMFDAMTPEDIPAEGLYGEGGVSEWLKTNSDKHLYEDSVYGEPMLDLSADKVKSFLSKALTEAEKEWKEKVRGEIVGMKKELLSPYEDGDHRAWMVDYDDLLRLPILHSDISSDKENI